MEKRAYKTEGIVLARRNFGEADRILVIFSKHYGKIRARAPGVRRPQSRKSAALELFNHARLFLASGKNMDIVTEAQTQNSFPNWRKDLVRVGIAYHLAEIVNRLTPERQEHREIFELLVDSFRELSAIDYWQLHPFIQSFKTRVLEELGYLERGKPERRNLDLYIEDLINGELRTKKFLAKLK